MRFNYKRKTYPAVKIGDVFYVRDKDFLKSECYKENKRLKEENKKLIKENEELKQKNKEAWLDYKDLRENYQTLDRAFKKLKKKVETTLFPVEYIDFIDHACTELLGEGDRVAYTFVMPWYKVKKYLDKKYKRGEKNAKFTKN